MNKLQKTVTTYMVQELVFDVIKPWGTMGTMLPHDSWEKSISKITDFLAGLGVEVVDE